MIKKYLKPVFDKQQKLLKFIRTLHIKNDVQADSTETEIGQQIDSKRRMFLLEPSYHINPTDQYALLQYLESLKLKDEQHPDNHNIIQEITYYAPTNSVEYFPCSFKLPPGDNLHPAFGTFYYYLQSGLVFQQVLFKPLQLQELINLRTSHSMLTHCYDLKENYTRYSLQELYTRDNGNFYKENKTKLYGMLINATNDFKLVGRNIETNTIETFIDSYNFSDIGESPYKKIEDDEYLFYYKTVYTYNSTNGKLREIVECRTANKNLRFFELNETKSFLGTLWGVPKVPRLYLKNSNEYSKYILISDLIPRVRQIRIDSILDPIMFKSQRQFNSWIKTNFQQHNLPFDSFHIILDSEIYTLSLEYIYENFYLPLSDSEIIVTDIQGNPIINPNTNEPYTIEDPIGLQYFLFNEIYGYQELVEVSNLPLSNLAHIQNLQVSLRLPCSELDPSPYDENCNYYRIPNMNSSNNDNINNNNNSTNNNNNNNNSNFYHVINISTLYHYLMDYFWDRRGEFLNFSNPIENYNVEPFRLHYEYERGHSILPKNYRYPNLWYSEKNKDDDEFLTLFRIYIVKFPSKPPAKDERLPDENQPILPEDENYSIPSEEDYIEVKVIEGCWNNELERYVWCGFYINSDGHWQRIWLEDLNSYYCSITYRADYKLYIFKVLYDDAENYEEFLCTTNIIYHGYITNKTVEYTGKDVKLVTEVVPLSSVHNYDLDRPQFANSVELYNDFEKIYIREDHILKLLGEDKRIQVRCKEKGNEFVNLPSKIIINFINDTELEFQIENYETALFTTSLETEAPDYDLIYLVLPTITVFPENSFSDAAFYKENNPYYLDLIKVGIRPSYARILPNRSIISYDKTILNDSELRMFMEAYTLSSTYFMSIYYNKTYELYPNYQGLVTILILFATMQRYLNLDSNYVLNPELMSLHEIENFFASYGITNILYIPEEYRSKLLLNIHRLFKKKGTDESFEEIFKIFEIDDIDITKYLLVKMLKFDKAKDRYIETTYQYPQKLEANYLRNPNTGEYTYYSDLEEFCNAMQAILDERGRDFTETDISNIKYAIKTQYFDKKLYGNRILDPNTGNLIDIPSIYNTPAAIRADIEGYFKYKFENSEVLNRTLDIELCKYFDTKYEEVLNTYLANSSLETIKLQCLNISLDYKEILKEYYINLYLEKKRLTYANMDSIETANSFTESKKINEKKEQFLLSFYDEQGFLFSYQNFSAFLFGILIDYHNKLLLNTKNDIKKIYILYKDEGFPINKILTTSKELTEDDIELIKKEYLSFVIKKYSLLNIQRRHLLTAVDYLNFNKIENPSTINKDDLTTNTDTSISPEKPITPGKIVSVVVKPLLGNEVIKTEIPSKLNTAELPEINIDEVKYHDDSGYEYDDFSHNTETDGEGGGSGGSTIPFIQAPILNPVLGISPISSKISWTSLGNLATGYRLQFFTENNVNAPHIDYLVNGTITEYLVNKNSDSTETKCFFRIQAVRTGARGIWTQLKEINFIFPPTLFAPVIINNTELKLTWSPSLSAALYKIQVSRNSEFASIEREITTTSLIYTFTDLDLSETSFIRVRAELMDNYSIWSNVFVVEAIEGGSDSGSDSGSGGSGSGSGSGGSGSGSGSGSGGSGSGSGSGSGEPIENFEDELGNLINHFTTVIENAENSISPSSLTVLDTLRSSVSGLVENVANKSALWNEVVSQVSETFKEALEIKKTLAEAEITKLLETEQWKTYYSMLKEVLDFNNIEYFPKLIKGIIDNLDKLLRDSIENLDFDSLRLSLLSLLPSSSTSSISPKIQLDILDYTYLKTKYIEYRLKNFLLLGYDNSTDINNIYNNSNNDNSNILNLHYDVILNSKESEFRKLLNDVVADDGVRERLSKLYMVDGVVGVYKEIFSRWLADYLVNNVSNIYEFAKGCFTMHSDWVAAHPDIIDIDTWESTVSTIELYKILEALFDVAPSLEVRKASLISRLMISNPSKAEIYDLRFLKVPIKNRNLEEEISKATLEDYIDYYEVTASDPYWKATKEEIFASTSLEKFNYLETKYYNIENEIYSLTKTEQFCILFNLLNVYLKEIEDSAGINNLSFIATDISEQPIPLLYAILGMLYITFKIYGMENVAINIDTDKYLSGLAYNTDEYTINLDEYKNNTQPDPTLAINIKGIPDKTSFVTYINEPSGNPEIPPTENGRINLIDFFNNLWMEKERFSKLIMATKNYNEYRRALDEYESRYKKCLPADFFNYLVWKNYTTYDEFFAAEFPEFLEWFEKDLVFENNNSDFYKQKFVSLYNYILDYIEDRDFVKIVKVPSLYQSFKDIIYQILNIFKSYTITIKDLAVVLHVNEMIENHVKTVDQVTNSKIITIVERNNDFKNPIEDRFGNPTFSDTFNFTDLIEITAREN